MNHGLVLVFIYLFIYLFVCFVLAPTGGRAAVAARALRRGAGRDGRRAALYLVAQGRRPVLPRERGNVM